VTAVPRLVSRRRRMLGRPAIAVHRAALALVRRLPARRSAGLTPDAPVRFVLANAHAMGGTVRAVLALAEQLAIRRPVEIIAVRRHVERPFFPHPARVTITVLDDRVAPRPLRQRLLGALPSLLVHPEDYAYPGASLWTDLQLLRRLRRARDGAVIATRPAWALLASAALPTGTPLVAQEHMHLRAHRPALAADIARRYWQLDALTVLTAEDRADYAELLPGLPVQVIPNPVAPLPGGAASPDARIVVAAGRLARQKGFDLLIDAFAGVAPRRPGAELRIYGGGKQKEALERQIAGAGLEGRVRLMGSTRSLGEAFAQGSVFVLSSRWEGFGVVLVEAMAAGLAAVSFDCPRGPGEILAGGRHGVLVEAGDVTGLARELEALLGDRGRRRALGVLARERARAYEPERIAARWEALLDGLEQVRSPHAVQATVMSL
jgi:glycosyltransferase involved in cell wall biosynthesis